ncbi:hypothetical protein [Pararhodonellum marinum]|uniref:hypothetical protein n=1 Tax=Pararhodonellum marinum TaxID=2755358 RepID=UPI00188EBE76|nr:hypothetical protein [Pararhodonellum marinum]
MLKTTSNQSTSQLWIATHWWSRKDAFPDDYNWRHIQVKLVAQYTKSLEGQKAIRLWLPHVFPNFEVPQLNGFTFLEHSMKFSMIGRLQLFFALL